MSQATCNEAPLITTIIPTYRRPRLLRRAILSALDQDGVPLKVCVYDNASGDETADVVAEIAANDARLFYYCHPRNIGGGKNFDFGMRAVDTQFFSLLSDDDYLLPGFYKKAVNALKADPNVMCWAGMTLNVGADGRIWYARVYDWPREGLFEPPEGFLQMTGGRIPVWTGMVFRRDVTDAIGFLDHSVLGPSDIEFCLRFAARFPYILEKYPSAILTLHAQSFSSTQPLSAFWPGWKRMIEKFSCDGYLTGSFRCDALQALRRDAQRMLLRRGAGALADGRTDFANEAANALYRECNLWFRARLLRYLAGICAHSAIAQRLYTATYRKMERQLVKSRSYLQDKYGHLLRGE